MQDMASPPKCINQSVRKKQDYPLFLWGIVKTSFSQTGNQETFGPVFFYSRSPSSSFLFSKSWPISLDKSFCGRGLREAVFEVLSAPIQRPNF